MHGQQNIKICNAEQAKHLYRYKNIKTKLYKCNAAIWYNKTCRMKHVTPRYINIKKSPQNILVMEIYIYIHIFYFSSFPTRYTILFRLHTVSAILFLLHVSGLTGPSSGGLNCTCSLWYSPPLQMSLSCGR